MSAKKNGVVDMSSAAVDWRLRQARDLHRNFFSSDEGRRWVVAATKSCRRDQAIDYSPEAVDGRLAEASRLRRLCLHLAEINPQC